MQDARCKMQDTGCRMQDVGCRPRVRVFRNMNRESHPYPGFPFSVGYQVPGSRYLEPDTRHRIDAEGRIPSTEGRVGHRVPGIGYQLPGTWDLVPGTGAGLTPRAGYRAPKTGPGPRASGLGHGGDGGQGGTTFPHPYRGPRTESRTPNPVPDTRYLVALLPYCLTALLPNCPIKP
jgi:hypothetical protein